MDRGNNTTNGGFSKAWDLVPGGQQTNVRIEIMQKCGWKSRQTFYSKLNGASEISNPELIVLKSIFEPFNINVETGRYIKELV